VPEGLGEVREMIDSSDFAVPAIAESECVLRSAIVATLCCAALDRSLLEAQRTFCEALLPAGATRMTLRRHLPVVRRRFALSTFTLPSEGSYHLLAGVDRADLLRGSNGELIALQFEEPDLGRASQNLVPR
jgi:hypothetical protein